ncbi:hypothetical protein PsYK624_033970 [Phanerochaete sordida]|uniref:Uncharacterized protein n=1 Tax=Phanerochaete sordida TaxID=48140 RepID=A0A9P3G3Q8_9APHY|nr:hypothetical protein PsYK624_033970 [Phanerochaete sordida]
MKIRLLRYMLCALFTDLGVVMRRHLVRRQDARPLDPTSWWRPSGRTCLLDRLHCCHSAYTSRAHALFSPRRARVVQKHKKLSLEREDEQHPPYLPTFPAYSAWHALCTPNEASDPPLRARALGADSLSRRPRLEGTRRTRCAPLQGPTHDERTHRARLEPGAGSRNIVSAPPRAPQDTRDG